MLNRLAQLIDERTDELAELESRNNGKTKWQCVAEIKVGGRDARAVRRHRSAPVRAIARREPGRRDVHPA